MVTISPPANLQRRSVIPTLPGKTWEVSGNVGYNDLSALGQALGKYTNLQAGFSCSIT